MLRLIFGYPSDIVRNVDSLFSREFKREWLFDNMCKDDITSIDKCKIDDSLFIYNDDDFLIGADDLSTGCKAVILLYKLNDIMIPLEFMGDNCFEMLAKISFIKDIRVCSAKPRRLFKHGFNEVFVVNTKKIITNGHDFLCEYVDIEKDFYGEYAYENRRFNYEW